jgi:hypothetical protein
MKKIKYIIVFILSLGIFNSCLIDNDTDLAKNAEGKNFVSFEQTTATFSAIADEMEYTFKIKVKLTGPNVVDATKDLAATVVVNDASTAIEGTHYRIDNPSITLDAANNHLVELEVTMLTAGIVTPLDASPILVLNLTNATGDANVVANGKPINITMNYACPSFLAGEYDVVTTRNDGAVYNWTETIKEIGVGTYMTEYVGRWIPPLQPTGMIFTDVCGVLNVPLQDLYQTYGNENYSHQPGFVDPVTGVLTIYYSITFDSGTVIDTFTGIYTPNF